MVLLTPVSPGRVKRSAFKYKFIHVHAFVNFVHTFISAMYSKNLIFNVLNHSYDLCLLTVDVITSCHVL